MIQVFKPSLTLNDKLSVLKAMYRNSISGTSPSVKEFEDSLRMSFNTKYVSTVSNGSAALDLSLQVLNLNENDEVVVPSHTIISCLSAILRGNAKPVFCDVDKNTWNMKLIDIEKVVTKKTKAVLMVHTYGLPTEAKQIKEYCKSKNLILIEDAAEAHGQTESGQLCGSFGDISTFSFYANKHITTGEGGAVLTNSEVFYEKINKMRNLDFNNKERFKHEHLYWNYRMGGLQAALGVSQSKQLHKTIKNKIKQGSYYQKLLSEYQDIVQLPLIEHNGSQNHYWVFGLIIKKDNIRDKVMETLKEMNIETRPFFWPLHLQPALPQNYREPSNSLPISENIGKNGLYIPLGKHVSKKDQEYIVKQLIEAINSHK
jgi:perosamine synthetase